MDCNMKRVLMAILPALLCCLIHASPVHAHRVSIFGWTEADTVHTESKFSGGKRVQGGKVEVFDSSGKLLVAGRTDDKGLFSFKGPTSADLNIVLSAGMGHRNTWRLSAPEPGGRDRDPFPEIQARPEPAPRGPREDASTIPAGTAVPVRRIEAALSRQLDAKLQPLVKEMAACRDEGPTIRDILGGIGYILGLVGLGAYVRYRRDERQR